MHLVRVTSRTREVSTEMNAVVCEEAQEPETCTLLLAGRRSRGEPGR
jgi:hypothetical protein